MGSTVRVPRMTDGKTTPWWVLLHEYDIYARLLEKELQKAKKPYYRKREK